MATAAEMHITVTLDDLPEIKAVIQMSLKLFDCQCEFEDYPGACAEYQEAWDTAMLAFKVTQNGGET